MSEGVTGKNKSRKRENIQDRFSLRWQAEKYRDRFLVGRRRNTHAREASALERVFEPLGRVDSIMDVACGPGRFASVLAAHCRWLLQTDYLVHMLHLSREDHPMQNGAASYFQADAHGLPLHDRSVDLVFCHRFLNHVADPAARLKVMKELARVSRQYVVVSCLGLPSVLRVIRASLKNLFGRKGGEVSVEVREFLKSAEETGLVLQRQVRIRKYIESGNFLVLTKK